MKVGEFTRSPYLGMNDRSRWATVVALLEHGTYQIDVVRFSHRLFTVDSFTKDGHRYSSKPAFLPTLVAAECWTLEKLFGWRFGRDDRKLVRAVLLTFNVLPFGLFLLLMSFLAERYAREDLTRIAIVAAAAFGTQISTFLVTLNNHTPAAFCVAGAMYCGVQVLSRFYGKLFRRLPFSLAFNPFYGL